MTLQLEEIAGFKLGKNLNPLSPHSVVTLDTEDCATAKHVIKILFDNSSARSFDPSAISRYEREVIALEQIATTELAHAVPRLLAHGDVLGNTVGMPHLEKVYYQVLEYFRGKILFTGIPVSAIFSDLNYYVDGNGDKLSRSDVKLTKKDYILEAVKLINLIGLVANLHEHGIVHGDLKPPNILSIDVTVKLLDFEYAEVEAYQYNTPHNRVGPLPYRDTAFIGDKPRDKAFDVYALACLIHDLFPFAVRDNLKLSHYLLMLYRVLGNLGVYLAGCDKIYERSKNAVIDPTGFIKQIESNQNLANRYLYDMLEYYETIVSLNIPHLPIENRSIRALRFYLMNSLFPRPELQPLYMALQMPPVQRIRDLGKQIMNQEPSQRMSAAELYRQLQPVKQELEAMLRVA